MNESFTSKFRFHLLVIFGICIVLYFLFFLSIGFFTHHGEELPVINVTNKSAKEAITALENAGFDVEVDSSYEADKTALLVLSQFPKEHSIVKYGRTIFITVNKTQAPIVPMPNLVNLSYSSACLILKSNRLLLQDTILKPNALKGAVLEQLYNGQVIRPGQMIQQGSKITLYVGAGFGGEQFEVPDLISLQYSEALALLSTSGLQYTIDWNTDITDSTTAIVYDQFPKTLNELGAANMIGEGAVMQIKIKQNPTLQEMQYNKIATPSVETTQ
jgi:beta-lactam-binding protein with PASTA domain